MRSALRAKGYPSLKPITERRLWHPLRTIHQHSSIHPLVLCVLTRALAFKCHPAEISLRTRGKEIDVSLEKQGNRYCIDIARQVGINVAIYKLLLKGGLSNHDTERHEVGLTYKI